MPAVALAARLLSRKGDIRKAAKLIETAWVKSPHPDLADVYLDLRPGDSNADRLTRATMLMRILPREPESRMAVARAALAARDFRVARDAMASLIAEGEQPTVRMCLIMADLEEAQHGSLGDVRAWLARASRAPRDAVWMADGVAAESWQPASPVTASSTPSSGRNRRSCPGLAIPLHPIDEAPEHAPPLALSHEEVETVIVEAPVTPEAALATDAAGAVQSPEPGNLTDGKANPKPVIFPQPALPDDPGAP